MTPPPLSDEQIYNLVWKEQLEQEALVKAVAAMRDAQWEGHNALQYVSDFGQIIEKLNEKDRHLAELQKKFDDYAQMMTDNLMEIAKQIEQEKLESINHYQDLRGKEWK